MREFSVDERAAIRADAAERFGSAERCAIIDLEDPIDVSVVMAPFDLASWAKHVDADARDTTTAKSQAFAARRLFPSMAEALDLAALWPAAPALVCARLYELAGQVLGVSASCHRFSLDTKPIWLPADEAKQLLDEHKADRLFVIAMPGNGLSVIAKAPLPDVFLAAEAAVKDARREGKGIVTTQLAWAKETVIRSATAIDAFLDQKPAAVADLWTGYRRMGGEGTATRVRRF